MKPIILGLILSLSAHAVPTIKCQADNATITVIQNSKQEIHVSYQEESVRADGHMDENEVDLIAKFPHSGEMTLFAKLGRNTSDNYLFFKGKRNPVICK
jgi:hypothetical protein